MDAAATPPPDLASVVAPQSRGPPGAARPPGQRDPGGSPTLAPFDLLLQLLGNALPAGQNLPVGGNGLPGPETGAPTAPTACAPAATVAAGQSQAGTRTSANSLADWLRLELVRAGGDPAASTATDPSSAVDATAPTSASGPAPALDAAPAPADAVPIDLQALLAANADTEAQAQPLAALASAPRERATSADSQRRAQATLVQAAGPAATSDPKPIDPTALHADLPAAVAVTQIPAALEKTVRADDALPLVTSATGVDSTSAPTVPAAPR